MKERVALLVAILILLLVGCRDSGKVEGKGSHCVGPDCTYEIKVDGEWIQVTKEQQDAVEIGDDWGEK